MTVTKEMLANEIPWIACKDIMPPDNCVVMTKIDDVRGKRNEQRLKYHSNLWWVPDGSMYVFYTPTHWRLDR
jgi:hypothetical protein